MTAETGKIQPLILLVEDEINLARPLHFNLEQEGYRVRATPSGKEALQWLLSEPFDLIILDIMIEEMDGFEVARRVRRQDQKLPILMLTARTAEADRIHGLELGADDYLIKPFAFSELLARVRTVLRRSPTRHPEILRIADLELDFLRHKATRGGKRLDLTPKEFLLLSLLARRADEVLSRTLIAEQVWDMNFDSDTNVVEVHVRRLRSKVDDPFATKLIHTVRGIGYVLEVR